MPCTAGTQGQAHQPQRIDYILTTGQAVEASVLDLKEGAVSFSDHCGVAALCRFNHIRSPFGPGARSDVLVWPDLIGG